MRWTTGVVAPPEQFTYWRELICAAFLDLTPESRLRDAFRGTVSQHELGRLDLARIDSQAQQVRRTEDDINRSPQVGYYANLQVRGECRTEQDGRVTIQRPGDLTVVDTTRPFTFEFTGDFRQLSLHLPEQLLETQMTGPLRTATRVATATGVGAAVRHALHSIDGGDLAPDSAARLATHTAGLLAVALDRPEPLSVTARHHRRLLDAALTDIEEHLGDDDLAPATTARRLGISVRLVHQLFAGRELTYSLHVQRKRLEQARRDLLDPARSALRIIDIAADAGFADVSHFHRTFRKVYGETPGHLRKTVGPPV
jgi:AraC family transcriptional regulator, positive regulator of tynA and feaB